MNLKLSCKNSLIFTTFNYNNLLMFQNSESRFFDKEQKFAILWLNSSYFCISTIMKNQGNELKRLASMS
jgi:hypothetical protein